MYIILSIKKTRELSLKKTNAELAIQGDEQISELVASSDKKSQELFLLNEKVKKLEKENGQSNIYMVGPNTNNAKRMCPVLGCLGNGSTTGGLTHYT